MLQRRRRDIQSFSNTGYIDDTINKEVTLANRSRISIRVTKKIGQGPRRGRPCKNFYHHAKFGCSASYRMGIGRGDLQENKPSYFPPFNVIQGQVYRHGSIGYR